MMAFEQLKKGLDFFISNIPFGEEENWTFTKKICFGKPVENICQKCKPYVLSTKFQPEMYNEKSNALLREQFKQFWDISLKNKNSKLFSY